jgi:hypothetical protein
MFVWKLFLVGEVYLSSAILESVSTANVICYDATKTEIGGLM